MLHLRLLAGQSKRGYALITRVGSQEDSAIPSSRRPGSTIFGLINPRRRLLLVEHKLVRGSGVPFTKRLSPIVPLLLAQSHLRAAPTNCSRGKDQVDQSWINRRRLISAINKNKKDTFSPETKPWVPVDKAPTMGGARVMYPTLLQYFLLMLRKPSSVATEKMLMFGVR